MDIYIVKEGETIDQIAKRFNLSIDDLKSVNDININNLNPGDEINIPFILSQDFIYYVIEQGDTLKNIADKNEVGIDILAHLNGLEINDYIYPNQTIIIPKDNVKIYITKSGDTIKDLERNVGFSLNKLMEDNPDIYLVANQLLIEREKL